MCGWHWSPLFVHSWNESIVVQPDPKTAALIAAHVSNTKIDAQF